MKTIHEIQAEARQLAARGERFRDTAIGADRRIGGTATPQELFHLPSAEGMHPVRSIDAVIEGRDIAYRLVERETPSAGQRPSDEPASVVMVSDSAFDVLLAGYELAEEERLAEQLEPYAELDDDESSMGEAATAVQAALETDLLSPVDRLKTKVEVAAFLEGRMEANALITHVIARQCHREDRREALVERQTLLLSIDES